MGDTCKFCGQFQFCYEYFFKRDSMVESVVEVVQRQSQYRNIVLIVHAHFLLNSLHLKVHLTSAHIYMLVFLFEVWFPQKIQTALSISLSLNQLFYVVCEIFST